MLTLTEIFKCYEVTCLPADHGEDVCHARLHCWALPGLVWLAYTYISYTNEQTNNTIACLLTTVRM